MTQDDFAFAWDGGGGWSHLRVAKFEGREALSELSRYELQLALHQTMADVAIDNLVGRRCTLRIATLSEPAHRLVHGVVAEGEELGPTLDARVFRVILMPRWVRARHQRRSRIFLDKTIRQIVDHVLEKNSGMSRDDGLEVEPDGGELDFRPAREAFAWRVADASRIDDPRARPYVVQYDESDFAFVSRLLEEEGIAYHFEDGSGVSLLVLSDRDAGLSRLHPETIGSGIPGRGVKSFQAGGRLRTTGVELGDFEWRKPRLDMHAAAHDRDELVAHAYPGGYYDAPTKGELLAKARLERYRTEASFARGEGGVRVLSAGAIFALEHDKPRHEGEYVVTELEVVGEQQGVLPGASDRDLSGVPFLARFECLRRGKRGAIGESRFRPERRTPRPRILGAQTAVVTADPGAAGAEVHVGGPDGLSLGCVRVRFHWDKEASRLATEPSSTWIRVSQPFAGVGEGGVWHPRVGVEVIVEFEEGNPDRPIIVGRVYNGANLPPYGGVPDVSTFKSFSTPGGAVHNEYTFTDTSGGELVYVNAGKDMTTNVGNDRTETIAVNGSMNIGVNNTESIGSNHTIIIGANDTTAIGANDTNAVGANSVSTVGANCVLVVGGNQIKDIGAAQEITVGGTHAETIGAAVTETYGASHDLTVSGAVDYTISANRTVTIGSSHTQIFGPQALMIGGNRSVTCPTLTTTVDGIELDIVGGDVESTVKGPYTATVGGGVFYFTPEWQVVNANGSDVDANKISMTGTSLSAVGAEVYATGVHHASTGVSVSVTGASYAAQGPHIELTGMDVELSAVQVEIAGEKIEAGLLIFL